MNDAVLQWVRELPSGDRTEPFSYEEWQRRGRSISNVTAALVELLAREELGAPSTQAVNIIYALGNVGDATAADALQGALHEANDQVRAEAASALGTLGVSAAFDDLRRLALDPAEDINVRANACMALGRLNMPASREALEAARRAAPLPTTPGGPMASGFLQSCVTVAIGFLRP